MKRVLPTRESFTSPSENCLVTSALGHERIIGLDERKNDDRHGKEEEPEESKSKSLLTHKSIGTRCETDRW